MNNTCFGMNLAATYFSSHTTISVEMQEHTRHSVRLSPKSSCAPSSFQGRVEPLDLINVLILKHYKRRMKCTLLQDVGTEFPWLQYGRCFHISLQSHFLLHQQLTKYVDV
ncbi:hypothetical protein CHARACLAT_011574 [Characodon lateralis]|uniref:Uncharacterized protein n=1 Tax=Characodon lateralis TaxID=208331 RepID=A0ABU7ET23_9TELE|nr:hypothetical protein [Characodon lateralis]